MESLNEKRLRIGHLEIGEFLRIVEIEPTDPLNGEIPKRRHVQVILEQGDSKGTNSLRNNVQYEFIFKPSNCLLLLNNCLRTFYHPTSVLPRKPPPLNAP